MRAHTSRSSPTQGQARSARAAARGANHVVSFVQTVTPPPVAAPRRQQQHKQTRRDADANRLVDRTHEWLHLLNTHQLRPLEELVAEDAIYHDDGMWLLQPASGRVAIRNVWRDFLRAVPDYRIEALSVATEPATNDAFVLWKASGVARLSLIPQRPASNKPFEHYGVTRLRFDSASGRIKEQWTWRGPTADEAKWLLIRNHKSFNMSAFLNGPSANLDNTAGGLETSPASGSPPGSPGASMDVAAAAAAATAAAARAPPRSAAAAAAAASRAKSAALAYREACGAVSGADVLQLLGSVLSDDYESREGTGIWRAVTLDSKAACLDYCLQRQARVAGSPTWHSEALSDDGSTLFIHFQNVLQARGSGMLVGISSGILVHFFDEAQQIRRSLMFRGPMSMSERAQFFNMTAACGRSQEELLSVEEVAGL